MRIHYIAQYGENPWGRKLVYSPAGLAKMKYIIESLQSTNNTLYIYSTSNGGSKATKLYWKKLFKINSDLSINYCTTYGSRYIILQILERVLNQFQLFIYLMFKVKNKDLVVIYHERFYLPIINLVRKLKKYKLIYEVEEIYTQVANYSNLRIQKEINGLRIADAYIFPNDSMAKKLEFDLRPFLVCYGSYKIENSIKEKFNDGKIHVVYAGTLEKHKGGAAAAAAAEYLNEKYHIHILGFGTEKQISEIQKDIQNISRKSKAIVTYDGVKRGNDYLMFLQKCHIGLSTQNPIGEFNETSFPSKILSYLANGLCVVSVRLEVLEKSKINELLFYCDNNSPLAISNAIKKVQLSNNYSSRAYVEDLGNCFVTEFQNLINIIEFN